MRRCVCVFCYGGLGPCVFVAVVSVVRLRSSFFCSRVARFCRCVAERRRTGAGFARFPSFFFVAFRFRSASGRGVGAGAASSSSTVCDRACGRACGFRRVRVGFLTHFLEGRVAESHTRRSDNRSVMPLDVRGRTRATLEVSAGTSPRPERAGKPLNHLPW